MKKNQTLYAAGTLVVLAVLYFLTQTGTVDTKTINVDVLAFDKGDVAAVELSGKEGVLAFSMKGDHWELENYPVDSVRIKQLLDLFSELKVDRLITQNPEKHAKYEVPEDGTRLLIKTSDGKGVLDLLIGKQGANFQETFVREYDQDEVYAVKSSLGQYKSRGQDYFWERSMTHLDVNAINGLDLSGEFDYSLKREGPTWKFNGEEVDTEKVLDLLRPLGNLKASNFSDEITSENTFYQSMVISLQGGDQIEMQFYLKEPSGALALVNVSDNDKIFEYSKAGLNRFNKKPADLKADPPPESS